jgi:Na+/phosphate symporter
MSGSRSSTLRRLVSAFLPSARVPEAATARFLNQEALAQPAVALDLVAREQLAVAQGLPQYLDDIREETRAQATESADLQHRNTQAVLKQIRQFTTELASRAESERIIQQVAQLEERSELLAMLGDSIRELADSVRDSMTSGALATLAASMAEGLHVVLLSTIDAMETPDQHNLEVLHHLTADRSQLMEGIRRSLVRGEQTLTIEEHQALFTSTRLFARVILLLRLLQTGLAPRG